MGDFKFWRAFGFLSSDTGALELTKFQLFGAGVRADGAAALTSSVAPSSGVLSSLQDDAVGTSVYWSSGAATLVISWQLPLAAAVDSIVLGAGTVAARSPQALILQGGPDGVSWPLVLQFGGFQSVPGQKSGVLVPASYPAELPRYSTFDYLTPGGRGVVPYTVKREILPRTNPRTYTPQWAKVRLTRDIDGKVIQQQWSDPVTGKGVFYEVDESLTYSVEAIYPDGSMCAVIADRIVPEVVA